MCIQDTHYRIQDTGHRTTVNISLNLNYCVASTPSSADFFFFFTSYYLLALTSPTREVNININTFIQMYLPLSIKKANLFSNPTLITNYISDPKIFWCDLLVKWSFVSTLTTWLHWANLQIMLVMQTKCTITSSFVKSNIKCILWAYLLKLFFLIRRS